MIPVQFITHQTKTISYEESALLALKGGCKWIQLRMKDASDEEVETLARRLKDKCREFDAVFVIDDRVELVKKIEADGVHLGKNDLPVDEARRFLGEGFLIGGTANTIEDVRRIHRASAEYIGCGPFRYTETKKNLSPVLGLAGYEEIMKTMRDEAITIPLCAIGGITLADVASIMSVGVDGYKFNTAKTKFNHTVHCVPACAADADDFDVYCAVRLSFESKGHICFPLYFLRIRSNHAK